MPKKPVFALIDCNNFFVSCERVFRPDLWGKPVAVLSNNDACIVARSNEVKALGVRMAEPHFKVKELLVKHNVTLFSANFNLYGDFSQRVVKVLEMACPNIEVYSVDESFLELSELPISDYNAWGRELSARIFRWTGIPVSVGVGPSKTLAKAAADYVKKHPDCQGAFSVVGDEAQRQELLKWLTLQSIWGVGYRSVPKLSGRGIKNAYDLSLVSDTWALRELTIRGLKMVRELRGESCYPLENSVEPQKTIARTRSFGHTVRNYYELEAAVATFAAQAALKLRRQKQLTHSVITYVRTSSRAEHTGQSQAFTTKLHPASSDTGAIIAAALKSLEKVYDPDMAYQKAGVFLGDLGHVTARQLMFSDKPDKIDRLALLMQTVDNLNAHYHSRVIRHASEQPQNKAWNSKRSLKSPDYSIKWTELPVAKAIF